MFAIFKQQNTSIYFPYNEEDFDQSYFGANFEKPNDDAQYVKLSLLMGMFAFKFMENEEPIDAAKRVLYEVLSDVEERSLIMLAKMVRKIYLQLN